MRIIEIGPAAILRFLLSEADFFVDEKDLQTFVGATPQSRFFLPIYQVIENRDVSESGEPGRSPHVA
jgi:hypothetical protein